MNKTKTCHIVSIPEREESLRLTVNSIINQVDLLFVILNGYEKIPAFLAGLPRVSSVMLDNSMTDAAKAYNIEDREGYVFLLDDDIITPKTYVSDLIEAIDKYKCIVTLHGKTYPRPFSSFYKIQGNYRCLGNVLKDVQVDVGGTGVMAWHTDHFKLQYSDLASPNMADIWISKRAMEQGVKIMVIAHTENYLKHVRYDDTLFVRENKKRFAEQDKILNSMFNG